MKLAKEIFKNKFRILESPQGHKSNEKEHAKEPGKVNLWLFLWKEFHVHCEFLPPQHRRIRVPVPSLDASEWHFYETLFGLLPTAVKEKQCSFIEEG